MSGLLRRLFTEPHPAAEPLADHIVLALPDGGSIEVVRVRHPRARRIKLTVNERGVRLTLPTRASMRAADAFLHEHRDWIAAQLPKWRTRETVAQFDGDAAVLPLRGRMLPLQRESGRYARVRCVDAGVVLTVPERAGEAAARHALKEFYLAQARADVGRWLPQYLPSIPRAPSVIRIRPLSSLWGSLSARDALSLDLALVLGAPAAFEYVLVHELCHLIHRHHRPAFWREVEARGQDWRAQRDYLHSHGAALKSGLRRLLMT